MTAMWSPLRLLHSRPETRGLLSADELVQAWQSSSSAFPAWATRPWIALLKRLKVGVFCFLLWFVVLILLVDRLYVQSLI